jgi:hypothetical protein
MKRFLEWYLLQCLAVITACVAAASGNWLATALAVVLFVMDRALNEKMMRIRHLGGLLAQSQVTLYAAEALLRVYEQADDDRGQAERSDG